MPIAYSTTRSTRTARLPRRSRASPAVVAVRARGAEASVSTLVCCHLSACCVTSLGCTGWPRSARAPDGDDTRSWAGIRRQPPPAAAGTRIAVSPAAVRPVARCVDALGPQPDVAARPEAGRNAANTGPVPAMARRAKRHASYLPRRGFTSHRVADGAGCQVAAFVTTGAVGVCRHRRRLGGRSPQDSTVRIVKMASRPTSPRA